MSSGNFRENLVLVGFMASGKTSIGRLLAKKLRRPFVDTDRMVIERERRDIPDIFAQDGESYFRQIETSVLESLSGDSGLIIATGGGIVTQPRNLEILPELGFVIWLSAHEEVIYDRVLRNQNRPLVQTENPRATIRDLYQKRSPLYEKVAQFAINTSTLPHRDVADAILAESRRRFVCTPPNGIPR